MNFILLFLITLLIETFKLITQSSPNKENFPVSPNFCHAKKTREIVHGLRCLSSIRPATEICCWQFVNDPREKGEGVEELECGAERKTGGNGNSEYEEKGKRGKGWGFLPLTIHLRGNPTNFPPFRHRSPFPTSNAKTVAPTVVS